MTALFADTFYWIALADFSDGAHRRTLALTSERADSLLVTTDEVLVDYLWVIPQSRASFCSGMALYRARPDKGYSLTDCISVQTGSSRQRTAF